MRSSMESTLCTTGTASTVHAAYRKKARTPELRSSSSRWASRCASHQWKKNTGSPTRIKASPPAKVSVDSEMPVSKIERARLISAQTTTSRLIRVTR